MNTKTIIILGSKGMLGQMVLLYFTHLKYNILELNERIDQTNIFRVIYELNKIEDGVVINCIGKIKQKSSDAFDLLWSNTILPLELKRSLKKSHFLIQPSTDCVFSGSSGSDYNVDEYNDAEDIYGWSKSLGEHALQYRPNTLIIRVSIIGTDKQSDKGLLSWFLNLKEGTSVKGYCNHLWNGITTLEWCKFVETYINSLEPRQYNLNTVQLGTIEVYSKFDMLTMFNEIFQRKIEIKPVAEGIMVRKVLKPNLVCKDLKIQLNELNSFLKSI